MAIQPGPQGQGQRSGPRAGDTAELRLKRARRRRPAITAVFAVLGVCGLLVAGFEINQQLKPRKFTPAQQRRIEAWEVAKRWRSTPKTKMFPAVVSYRLVGGALGPSAGLALTARRLEIATQATCAKGAGASKELMTRLAGDDCQAVLRATYADATSSLVVTVGVAVLRDQASAESVASFLIVGGPQSQGAVSRQLVLHPFQVAGTPAALFGNRQRQLSWVVGAGSYLVMATVGYSDGRPQEPVTSDSYTYLEMTSLARSVADLVARPLGAPPPVPHCPGALTAC